MQNNKKFFLGANSAVGFINKFENIKENNDEIFTYIIKGGPGTGKSSFMKKIAQTNENAVLFPCSSDPDSLDAVLLKDKKIMVLDGTAPHIVEPKYPGVREEIINLGQFWDKEKLQKNKNKIIELTENNKKLHKKASAYIRAAGKAEDDIYGIALSAVDIEKTVNEALSLCRKYLYPENNKTGKEYTAFLSAITPLGHVFYSETLEMAENRIVVEDKYSAAGDVILSVVRERALKYGYDIITVPDSLIGLSRLKHIIIPELSLAFCLENEIKINSNHRKIHAKRFYDDEYLKSKRQRINFDKKAKNEFLNSGVDCLKEAKAVHDKLESYYIKAMDFKAINSFTEKFIKKISAE